MIKGVHTMFYSSADHGYELVTQFHEPGDFWIQLYQPK